jgi:hypothetical protein
MFDIYVYINCPHDICPFSNESGCSYNFGSSAQPGSIDQIRPQESNVIFVKLSLRVSKDFAFLLKSYRDWLRTRKVSVALSDQVFSAPAEKALSVLRNAGEYRIL